MIKSGVSSHIFRDYFLEHAFDDYFEQIKKALKLLDKIHIRFYGYFTIGYYMKELALLEREREDLDSILKCIEDFKEQLEKYNYLRSFSQPIDGSIARNRKRTQQIRRKTFEKQRY